MSQVETAPFPVEPGSGGFGVWADLVGQGRAVDTLRRAVAGGPHAMSHAWLITGPPGSDARMPPGPSPLPWNVNRRIGPWPAAGVPRLPYRAQRSPSRCHPGPHRDAVHRGRRDPRPGAPGVDEPERRPPSGAGDRGCRSGHRARGRCVVEEHRGPHRGRCGCSARRPRRMWWRPSARGPGHCT